MPLEVLHGALVRFGLLARSEGSEVALLAGFGIFLARVQTVFTGLQFANHKLLLKIGCGGGYVVLSVAVHGVMTRGADNSGSLRAG